MLKIFIFIILIITLQCLPGFDQNEYEILDPNYKKKRQEQKIKQCNIMDAVILSVIYDQPLTEEDAIIFLSYHMICPNMRDE